MKINIASLAVGIGIGLAIAIAISAVFPLRLEPTTPEPASSLPADSVDVLTNSNRTHFFMSGLIKQMSAKSMVIDQTFGNPQYTDNPNVTIRLDRGAGFLNCYDNETGQSAQDPASCSNVITDDQIAEGLNVCAHTRMYNGEFYAGKTWLNASCGPFQNEMTTSENLPEENE